MISLPRNGQRDGVLTLVSGGLGFDMPDMPDLPEELVFRCDCGAELTIPTQGCLSGLHPYVLETCLHGLVGKQVGNLKVTGIDLLGACTVCVDCGENVVYAWDEWARFCAEADKGFTRFCACCLDPADLYAEFMAVGGKLGCFTVAPEQKRDELVAVCSCGQEVYMTGQEAFWLVGGQGVTRCPHEFAGKRQGALTVCDKVSVVFGGVSDSYSVFADNEHLWCRCDCDEWVMVPVSEFESKEAARKYAACVHGGGGNA